MTTSKNPFLSSLLHSIFDIRRVPPSVIKNIKKDLATETTHVGLCGSYDRMAKGLKGFKELEEDFFLFRLKILCALCALCGYQIPNSEIHSPPLVGAGR